MIAATLRRARTVYRDGLDGLWFGLTVFVGIIVVIFVGIGLIISATGGFDGAEWTSVWEQVMYAARYFPLSMGAILMMAFLPIAVSFGVTRTSYLIGFAGLVVTLNATVAVVVAAGHLVEHALFQAGGAAQELTSPHLFTAGDQVGWVAAETLIIGMANTTAGALIGVAYFKWHWLWTTLALPIILVPLAVAEGLMAVGWAGNVVHAIGFDRGPLGLVIPATLAVTAAMVVGTLIISRHTDISACSG